MNSPLCFCNLNARCFADFDISCLADGSVTFDQRCWADGKLDAQRCANSFANDIRSWADGSVNLKTGVGLMVL